MLADDPYASIDSPFSMLAWTVGLERVVLLAPILLQGVDGTWIHIRVDGRSNHRNEHL